MHDQVSRRAQSLLLRFTTECEQHLAGHPWHEDPRLLCNWVARLQQEQAPSTFRCNRRWLALYADNQGFPDIAELIRAVARSPGNQDKTSKKKPRGYDRKSELAKFAENINRSALRELSSELLAEKRHGDGPKYQYGELTLLWFQTTMMTGVRPVEWRSAMMMESLYSPRADQYFGDVLQITTAKGRTEVQADHNDRLRNLILQDFSEVEQQVIDTLISRLPVDERQFQDLYQSCRKTLNRALGHVGLRIGGPLTVYSARHLFCSELRADGHSRIEVAALMGHSDCANQVYYGGAPLPERQFGHSLPKPWPEAVETVEQRDRERNPLLYDETHKAILDLQQ